MFLFCVFGTKQWDNYNMLNIVELRTFFMSVRRPTRCVRIRLACQSRSDYI